MFPNLEFVKTAMNAITAKFQRVKSDVDAVQANVDAVKSDVDAVKSDVDAVKSDVDAVKSNAPDWNEQDSASHAYIKNKPCYDYIEPSGVIWESNYADTSGQGPLMLIDLVDGRLIDGETYRLTVNGVETTYTCAADADGDGLYIGTGYADVNGSNIYQSNTSTELCAWTRGLWNYGQKVRLEGPLRRYKKLDVSLYDAVVSVNGETGEVQITPENIGAAKAGSNIINLDGKNTVINGLIYGTYKGSPCHVLYLGGNRYFKNAIETGTGEECFVLGPKDTILGGIKTPINDDQAVNKAYVDATIAEISSAAGEAEQHARVAEQHARVAEQHAQVAQECAQAMAGTFDFTGYLRYQIVNAAPETYDEGVLYIVTTA